MKSLLEKLREVYLTEERVKVLSVGAMGLAHYKDTLCAIWWYNILNQKLEYSEEATTHQDRSVFKEPFIDERGWIRGRLFFYKGKYYIVVYLEDWQEYPVTNNSIANLYNQIQDKFAHTISDVVDEEGYSLAENKKKSR